MKYFIQIVITSLLMSGCTSTYVALVYDTKCTLSQEEVFASISDSDFLLEKINDVQAMTCRGKKFNSYKIIRKNIIQEHLDGRKFNIDEVEQRFYASYNPQLCKLTIVAPLTGKVPDTSDVRYILNKYYFSPFISRISSNHLKQPEIVYSANLSFGSEGEFKKYCEEQNTTYEN